MLIRIKSEQFIKDVSSLMSSFGITQKSWTKDFCWTYSFNCSLVENINEGDTSCTIDAVGVSAGSKINITLGENVFETTIQDVTATGSESTIQLASSLPFSASVDSDIIITSVIEANDGEVMTIPDIALNTMNMLVAKNYIEILV